MFRKVDSSHPFLETNIIVCIAIKWSIHNIFTEQRKIAAMFATELKIEGSKTLPAISFKDGKLNIVGRSILHDAGSWYVQLSQVLSNYIENPVDSTEINIQLDYLNSDSNRALINLLLLLEKVHHNGKKVLVQWYYDDSDYTMYDQGSIFKSLIDLPFSFVPIN